MVGKVNLSLLLCTILICHCGQSAWGAEISSRVNTSPALPSYDTIIVGLGASGITALSKLARHGKRVLGLEAADRIGGRVNTVTLGDGVLELGAEWIHGRNNSKTYELALTHGVMPKLQDDSIRNYQSDGTPASDAVNELSYLCLHDDDAGNTTAKTMGEFLTKRCTDYVTKTYPYLLKSPNFMKNFLRLLMLEYISNDGATSWDEIPVDSNYMELDSFTLTSWHKYGYRTLFDIIMNKFNNGPGLPSNAEIKLSKEVSKIVWSDDPTAEVVVKCVDGSEYKAKNVIVTVSVGVLKARHAELFSPALPQVKVKAIEKIPMGVLDKIVLSYDKAWWPSDITYFGFYWKDEDMQKLSDDLKWTTEIGGASCSMGSDNVLVLWMSGDKARQMESLSDEVVKHQAVALIRRFLNANAPEPKEIIRTNWFTNPLTLGSYTYDNIEMASHSEWRVDYGAPLLDSAGNPKVLFAGEGTNPTHYSTVHGAVETGIREANKLLGDDKISIY